MAKPKVVSKRIDFDYFESVMMLNALTNETYLASIIDIAKCEYFKNDDIKVAWGAISSFYEERASVPNHTEIKARLLTDAQKQSFKNVVNSFKILDTKYNPEELMFNTEQFLRERAVYNTVLKTLDRGSKGEIDATEVLTDFEGACNISIVEDLGFDYLEQIDKHVEAIQEIQSTISSGWKELDKKINGGLLATGRALYIFVGATNVGKSIFLGNIAANILKQEKTVLLISLEMPEQMYGKRISSQLTSINIGDLHNNTDVLSKDLKNLKSQIPEGKLIIKEFPPKSVTVDGIKAYVKKLRAKGVKPDVIVVDYINLIQAKSGNNSYEQIKNVAEQLRALSYVFKCPIVSASQINRSNYGGGVPGLDSVSESMGLAHTADAMFSIHQDDGDEDLGILRLNVIKNRFGRKSGNITMKINYDTLTLTDIENDGGVGMGDVFNSADTTLKNILGG